MIASPFGQGLAEEVKKRLNRRGVSEALFYHVSRPRRWITPICWTSCARASIEVLYVGGLQCRRPASSSVKPRPRRTTSNWSPATTRCQRRVVPGWCRSGRRRSPVHVLQPIRTPGTAAAAGHGPPSARRAPAAQRAGRSIATPPLSSGRRRSRRQARRTPRLSPKRYANSSSTRCSARIGLRRQGRRHRLRSVRLVRLDRRQVRGEGPDRIGGGRRTWIGYAPVCRSPAARARRIRPRIRRERTFRSASAAR